jgi:GNAT superfamily N-acetyltransferase
VSVEHVDLEAILPMREDYRREMRCQIVHDCWHARGYTDSFLLRSDGVVVGYGAVGGAPGDPRTTLKEFYVLPERRGEALALCHELVQVSDAATIEAQTNDRLLVLMLLDCASALESETVIFEDAVTVHVEQPGVVFRRLTAAERAAAFPHTFEPVGDWALFEGRLMVASGGFLTHYNPPYADIHMEVAQTHLRRGLGTFIVQELKRVCREAGYVPAARCHETNVGSRRALERAGMWPCARIVKGAIRSR